MALDVVGPGGGTQTPIVALLDTGADASMLPLDYAVILGYTTSNLQAGEAQQAQGVANIHEATEPCIACIAGSREPTFTLRPIFTAGALNSLWGRRDFFQRFPVAFYEERKEFVVTFPDPRAGALLGGSGETTSGNSRFDFSLRGVPSF